MVPRRKLRFIESGLLSSVLLEWFPITSMFFRVSLVHRWVAILNTNICFGILISDILHLFRSKQNYLLSSRNCFPVSATHMA